MQRSHNSVGNSLQRWYARVEESVAAYRTAAMLSPADAGFRSNAVYAMQFHPGATESDLYREQRLWNDLYAKPLQSQIKPHENDRSETRRLKVEVRVAEFLFPCRVVLHPTAV